MRGVCNGRQRGGVNAGRVKVRGGGSQSSPKLGRELNTQRGGFRLGKLNAEALGAIALLALCLAAPHHSRQRHLQHLSNHGRAK